MQNEIIHYFDNIILHHEQTDINELNTQLIRDGFIIHFEYGKGTNLIYDYENLQLSIRILC